MHVPKEILDHLTPLRVGAGLVVLGTIFLLLPLGSEPQSSQEVGETEGPAVTRTDPVATVPASPTLASRDEINRLVQEALIGAEDTDAPPARAPILARPNPRLSGDVYTVKKGDTLASIAQARYGNAMAYTDIYEANRHVLRRPEDLAPGQKITLPAQLGHKLRPRARPSAPWPSTQ